MKTSRISELAIVVTMCLPPSLAAQSLQTPCAPLYSAPSNSVTEPVQGQGQASQLILWSQAEKPQPAPIPFPRAKPADRARDSAPTQKRIMIGTIERSGKFYVLRVSDSSASQFPVAIQIDDQQSASRFEGRQVKLTGMFDQASSSVQVDSIELIS